MEEWYSCVGSILDSTRKNLRNDSQFPKSAIDDYNSSDIRLRSSNESWPSLSSEYNLASSGTVLRPVTPLQAINTTLHHVPATMNPQNFIISNPVPTTYAGTYPSHQYVQDPETMVSNYYEMRPVSQQSIRHSPERRSHSRSSRAKYEKSSKHEKPSRKDKRIDREKVKGAWEDVPSKKSNHYSPKTSRRREYEDNSDTSDSSRMDPIQNKDASSLSSESPRRTKQKHISGKLNSFKTRSDERSEYLKAHEPLSKTTYENDLEISSNESEKNIQRKRKNHFRNKRYSNETESDSQQSDDYYTDGRKYRDVMDSPNLYSRLSHDPNFRSQSVLRLSGSSSPNSMQNVILNPIPPQMVSVNPLSSTFHSQTSSQDQLSQYQNKSQIAMIQQRISDLETKYQFEFETRASYLQENSRKIKQQSELELEIWRNQQKKLFKDMVDEFDQQIEKCKYDWNEKIASINKSIKDQQNKEKNALDHWREDMKNIKSQILSVSSNLDHTKLQMHNLQELNDQKFSNYRDSIRQEHSSLSSQISTIQKEMVDKVQLVQESTSDFIKKRWDHINDHMNQVVKDSTSQIMKKMYLSQESILDEAKSTVHKYISEYSVQLKQDIYNETKILMETQNQTLENRIKSIEQCVMSENSVTKNDLELIKKQFDNKVSKNEEQIKYSINQIESDTKDFNKTMSGRIEDSLKRLKQQIDNSLNENNKDSEQVKKLDDAYTKLKETIMNVGSSHSLLTQQYQEFKKNTQDQFKLLNDNLTSFNKDKINATLPSQLEEKISSNLTKLVEERIDSLEKKLSNSISIKSSKEPSLSGNAKEIISQVELQLLNQIDSKLETIQSKLNDTIQSKLNDFNLQQDKFKNTIIPEKIKASIEEHIKSIQLIQSEVEKFKVKEEDHFNILDEKIAQLSTKVTTGDETPLTKQIQKFIEKTLKKEKNDEIVNQVEILKKEISTLILKNEQLELEVNNLKKETDQLKINKTSPSPLSRSSFNDSYSKENNDTLKEDTNEPDYFVSERINLNFTSQNNQVASPTSYDLSESQAIESNESDEFDESDIQDDYLNTKDQDNDVDIEETESSDISDPEEIENILSNSNKDEDLILENTDENKIYEEDNSTKDEASNFQYYDDKFLNEMKTEYNYYDIQKNSENEENFDDETIEQLIAQSETALKEYENKEETLYDSEFDNLEDSESTTQINYESVNKEKQIENKSQKNEDSFDTDEKQDENQTNEQNDEKIVDQEDDRISKNSYSPENEQELYSISDGLTPVDDDYSSINSSFLNNDNPTKEIEDVPLSIIEDEHNNDNLNQYNLSNDHASAQYEPHEESKEDLNSELSNLEKALQDELLELNNQEQNTDLKNKEPENNFDEPSDNESHESDKLEDNEENIPENNVNLDNFETKSESSRKSDIIPPISNIQENIEPTSEKSNENDYASPNGIVDIDYDNASIEEYELANESSDESKSIQHSSLEQSLNSHNESFEYEGTPVDRDEYFYEANEYPETEDVDNEGSDLLSDVSHDINQESSLNKSNQMEESLQESKDSEQIENNIENIKSDPNEDNISPGHQDKNVNLSEIDSVHSEPKVDKSAPLDEKINFSELEDMLSDNVLAMVNDFEEEDNNIDSNLVFGNDGNQNMSLNYLVKGEEDFNMSEFTKKSENSQIDDDEFDF